MVSLVWAPARFQKIAETRQERPAEHSSAVIVFLKVGFAFRFAISSISARPSFIALSKAGAKSASSIAEKSREAVFAGPVEKRLVYRLAVRFCGFRFGLRHDASCREKTVALMYGGPRAVQGLTPAIVGEYDLWSGRGHFRVAVVDHFAHRFPKQGERLKAFFRHFIGIERPDNCFQDPESSSFMVLRSLAVSLVLARSAISRSM